jgi:hypothetical protein
MDDPTNGGVRVTKGPYLRPLRAAILAGWALAIGLVCPGAALAHLGEVVDQKQETTLTVTTFNPPVPPFWGQTFTPTANNIVAFDVAWCSVGDTAPRTIVLRQGGPSGPTIASVQVVLPHFVAGVFAHAHFPAPVPLTPGTTYALGVANGQSGCVSLNFNTYPGGQAIGGAPEPIFDSAFRTYYDPDFNPAAEVCDGADNDADGQTDEGFADTDNDGQANCVDPDDDGDGIADAVDESPLAVSARFSDKGLNGRTAGRIVSVPTGVAVSVVDHENAARGVRVTVSGATGGRVQVQLDGKRSTIRLRSPGTYTITDPVADTTVETVTGGPAEVELVLGGATMLVVIDADEEATIRENDSDGNGTVDSAVVFPGAGDTITVNGTPIGPGQTLNIAPLQSTRLTIEDRREFELGTVLAAGPINPRAEPVGIRVGTYSTTIPAGRFVLTRGKYIFAGRINGVRLAVAIAPLFGGGRYAVAASAEGANLTATRNPVTVQVTIGDDSGTAAVRASFR